MKIKPCFRNNKNSFILIRRKNLLYVYPLKFLKCLRKKRYNMPNIIKNLGKNLEFVCQKDNDYDCKECSLYKWCNPPKEADIDEDIITDEFIEDE